MTKSELTKLAVRALGEGARVLVAHPIDYDGRDAKVGWYAEASPVGDLNVGVNIWARTRASATRALAAALTAFAEGK